MNNQDEFLLELIRRYDGARRLKLFDNDIESCDWYCQKIDKTIKKINSAEGINEAMKIENAFNEYREKFRYPSKFGLFMINFRLWFLHNIYGDPNIRYTPDGYVHCDY